MRRSFTLCSIGAHTIVIAAALYAQILADSSSLPTPHRPILFDTSQIMPIDIQPPKPRARAAIAAHAESDNAAPIVPPDHFTPEPEYARGGDAAVDGAVGGDDHDLLSNISGVGIATPLPAPPPPPATPVRLHSGMTRPVKIADVAPVYPAIARSARIQGVVILEAVLDAAGRVQSVGVLRSIPLLDQAAVDAVRQWRFTPALLNGEAVPVVMTVTVNFTLRE